MVIQEVIEHLENMINTKDDQVSKIDGYQIYYTDWCIISLEKEKKIIKVNFDIFLYPEEVVEIVIQLLDFVNKNDLTIVVGESFATKNDEIFFGDCAKNIFQETFREKCESEIYKEDLMDDLFEGDQWFEC